MERMMVFGKRFLYVLHYIRHYEANILDFSRLFSGKVQMLLNRRTIMDRLYHNRHRKADVLGFPGPFSRTVRLLAPGAPHYIRHQMGEISKSLMHF